MSNPREIKSVIERHEKLIEKLEIERTNKIKELKELETLKNRIRRNRTWKNRWSNSYYSKRNTFIIFF